MLHLLAMDLGASSGRAMLAGFDGERLTLEEIHRFANEPVTAAGTMYWDTLRLLHEIKQGIRMTVRRGIIPASMGIDTWGVDFGLLDAGGNLLGNAVHYRDARTVGMMEKVFSVVPKDRIYRSSGIQFLNLNTLYQVYAMKLADSPLLSMAETLLCTPDLLNYFLTGVKATESTIASTTQMMDARTGDWDFEMLEALGLPINLLPQILPPCTVLGPLTDDVCRELDVPPIPVIAVSGHDTGCAVAATPLADEGAAYISSGTWSILGVERTEPVITEASLRHNYSNEGGIAGTFRVLTNIMGLWIIQECRREMEIQGRSRSFAELAVLAQGAKPFRSLIDPDDAVFNAPGHMTERVRAYCRSTGQPEPEDDAEVTRCVMDSLALKYRMSVDELVDVVGMPVSALHIVGGGSQNQMLNQNTASAMGMPVITGPVEATATGNVLSQLMALGEVSSMREARELVRRSFPAQVWEPKDCPSWQDAFERYGQLIRK